MRITPAEMGALHDVLARKEHELVRLVQRRDDVVIEKSADQMDQIQYASERDMAMQNVDRESTSLRHVRAALGRMLDGSFGICVECESAISPKRLAAVPWAPRCLRCQEAADRVGNSAADMVTESAGNAA